MEDGLVWEEAMNRGPEDLGWSFYLYISFNEVSHAPVPGLRAGKMCYEVPSRTLMPKSR